MDKIIENSKMSRHLHRIARKMTITAGVLLAFGFGFGAPSFASTGPSSPSAESIPSLAKYNQQGELIALSPACEAMTGSWDFVFRFKTFYGAMAHQMGFDNKAKISFAPGRKGLIIHVDWAMDLAGPIVTKWDYEGLSLSSDSTIEEPVDCSANPEFCLYKMRFNDNAFPLLSVLRVYTIQASPDGENAISCAIERFRLLQTALKVYIR